MVYMQKCQRRENKPGGRRPTASYVDVSPGRRSTILGALCGRFSGGEKHPSLPLAGTKRKRTRFGINYFDNLVFIYNQVSLRTRNRGVNDVHRARLTRQTHIKLVGGGGG